MGDRVTVGGLEVAPVLHAFVRDEALPGTGVDEAAFWSGVEALLTDFVPRNRTLLERRSELQQQLDEWHEKNPGPVADQAAYVQLLRDLGYLVDEPVDFSIETSNVDEEVAVQAGPQLVVPVLNARFAANAANARWGSLYDALYGTDALPEDDGQERGSSYNPKRGAAVIARARAFLDEHFPLAEGSHADSTGYSTEGGVLTVRLGDSESGLADPAQYVGHRGDPADPEGVLLVHHGLHVEIQVDREDQIGKDDAAGVKDLLLEAAVSTIMDLEDSVAAVDPDDKVAGYRNWLQLNQGTLSAEVAKGGSSFTRTLEDDRLYDGPSGQLVLPGRSLLFVRQVGHLMTTDAILFDARRRCRRDPRGHPRRGHDRALQPGRHPGPQRARQLADRLDVRREAEDARPRRGAVHRRPVRGRRGPARTGPRHDQARHHGRGAPHLGEPQGLHPCGAGTGRVHQHRVPRPHRRRAAHLDAGRRDDPQGRHEVDRVDQGLRGPERRHRARLRAAGQGADRQGHVGDARRDGRDARAEDRAPAGGCVVRMGALADRRHAARTALPPGGRGGAPAGTGRGPAYDDRAAAHHPVCAGHRLERRGPDRRDREQPAGDPGLREALGRRRRRLLEGARHPRHRADGGPRHLPDLLPARRQLASPRRGHRRRGRGGVPPDGGRGRRAAGGRRLRPHGPVVRRRGVRGRPRPGLRGAQPALGLHRADPAPPPSRPEERRSAS